MTQKVLILGGRGRVGQQVAAELWQWTKATLTVTGRRAIAPREAHCLRCTPMQLDLENTGELAQAIAAHHLVIHCAGPFSYRDNRVLQYCIEAGVPYLDVADNPRYLRSAQTLHGAAQAAGVTAILSTGVFPGISNSLARQGVESLDQTDEIRLSYVVAGSGGAGKTVMRTTFLELQHPLEVYIEGQWRTLPPYSQKEILEFPAPFGHCAVYLFNTTEAATLPHSFPVQTVITKFGTLPHFYNPLTGLMAHGLPNGWLQNPFLVEFLSQVSYQMTQVTNYFSGIGIAIRADIKGYQDGQPTHYLSTFYHPNTAQAVGIGTAGIAQFVLSGQLHQPGVWPVEQALPTPLFETLLRQRDLHIHQSLQPWNR